MCGGENNIRIERAGNGFLIDSYEPSKTGDRPGEHKRHVATDAAAVVHIIKKHLGKSGKGIKTERKSTARRKK